MLRNRYVSHTSQRNYIRQRYNMFNTISQVPLAINERINEDDIATAKNDEIDIYDEDEEMIQVSDIESEEASEDDIDEFETYHENSESEYERMMSEIDERDEEDREEIGEENLDEEIIVDKPFEGQEVTENKELWHGNIWKESARFGQASITITEDLYNSGDFVIYREPGEPKKFGRILAIVQKDDRRMIKIQRIIRYEELPGNLQSNNRKERSLHGELWFLDREMDDAIVCVELQAIVRRVLITILYDTNNNRHSIKIREILYKHNGYWKLRHVKYSYQHPSEFAALEEPITNLPVYKWSICSNWKHAN
ncbi:unnamed protein product [Rhizophagus irregularis]|uniref:BAH domain-containing protein n=1 Tax=Rhizophagus irregularis TaxID=588596 RepID=A0A915YQC8_9GLOM|nr:unnamed protein product [Rhizophagus irregularis]